MNNLATQDAENRQKALAIANFIVEAPAGAGKTELLTQRYLKLLSTVESPEEIVALTFTNKAAAEMRNRILAALEAAQNKASIDAAHKQKTRELAEKALQHAQQMGWRLLKTPARLRILTMDALCSSLARQMPLLSKFGGQPKVTLDATAHYQTAAQQTLAEISKESNSENSAQAIITTALRFMHNDIEKLTELLAKMLEKRDQWQTLAGTHANISVDEIAKNVSLALQQIITQGLDLTIETMPASYQTMLMPVVRFAASNVEETHALKPLQDWQIPLQARPEDLQKWQILGDFLLNKDGEFRKKLDKNNGFLAKDKNHPENEVFKQNFTEITQLIANPKPLFDALSLPDMSAENIVQDCTVVKALAQLLQLATAHLWTTFQAANEVDFVAIAQSASDALENERGATDLALKLDYKISHLLVDEFQDTSPTQMRLIEQLTQGWAANDGRTLFCVGDPMQSIYRFRKADVSLFLRAAERGIGQLSLAPLKLALNYRSHPKVVDWINDNFKHIFPATDDEAQAAIHYRPFQSSKNTVADEGVEVHPLLLNLEDESDEAKIAEARYVANLIEKESKINTTQKIAVLVRSRTHLRELVSVIRREFPTLKFQAVEIEGLQNRQTVLDALSLTRALLHRADRVHWLSVLRAPWCGLTLADLHKLAGDDHYATIWQLMQDDARVQTLNEPQRLLHVRDILGEAFAQQGRMPLRRWLESTWLKLGGANTLINVNDNRDVQAFFDLVDSLASGYFIDFEQLDNAMKKLYAEPDITENDHLQFLTIHKSKGLEFDCVILPALNRKPRDNDAPLMLWEEVQTNQESSKQIQLIAAPYSKTDKQKPSVYDFLKALENGRSNNETSRLLYVAMTRSIRKCHLIATIKPNKNNELNPSGKSLLALLWPNLAAQFAAATPVANNKQTQARLADFTPKLMRLNSPAVPDLLKNLPKMQSPAPLLNPQTQQILPALNLAADVGSLAHLYMEMIANEGLEKWPASRMDASVQSMQFWLLQRGHAKNEVEKYVVNIINALKQTIASLQGAWILAPRASSQAELSVTSMSENELQEHRIDLTFVENEVRWIIDYKFGLEVNVDNANAVAQTHQPQLARYAALFTHENLPIKTAVFFLSLAKLIVL
jgi:ATP-dependent exoDNAse (exonuclease V) beta subunit